MAALSALLWTASAPGQPGSQGETPGGARQPVMATASADVAPDTGRADEPLHMPCASLEYTIAVIALGGLGLLVSLGLLCLPAVRPAGSDG